MFCGKITQGSTIADLGCLSLGILLVYKMGYLCTVNNAPKKIGTFRLRTQIQLPTL